MKPAPTDVYIVEFSDGITKVGCTADMAQRLGPLSHAADKRGANITDLWSFKSNRAYVDEQVVLEMARAAGEPAWGVEYFRGIRFQDFAAQVSDAFKITPPYRHVTEDEVFEAVNNLFKV